MKKLIRKIFFNKNKTKEIFFKNYTEPKINKFKDIVSTKEEISFLHYGHLGDIINCLPVIKELSKNSKCSLYIQKEKLIPDHVASGDHPFGKVYLSEKSIKKFLPLLKSQNYLFNVEIFNNQKIDIDLNFFRELNINFNIDSVRWYSHLTGIHPDLSKKYLEVEGHSKFQNHIVILRSLRRQNKFINYSFLNNYEKIVFVGLENEFNDLKKSINHLEHYDCKDFLELASIIKNSKVFIGNLSFGYAIAEALKVPRLLESAPDFPLVYPNGSEGYDFYFQSHFECLVKKLVGD